MTSSWTRLVSKAKRFRNAHWPRYIFIHINKTAGSSIERALGLRFEHKTAIEKREELGEYLWNRAFKFSFVRNPWDKVFSHYNYRVATNQTGMGDRHISFCDWVLRAYGDEDPRYYDQPRMFMPQHSWLVDSRGELVVEFIGRFETLSEDFAAVCKLLHVRAALPHLKATVRTRYQLEYSSDARACIEERFSRDIKTFGYDF